jgi:hypothetical protein
MKLVEFSAYNSVPEARYTERNGYQVAEYYKKTDSMEYVALFSNPELIFCPNV